MIKEETTQEESTDQPASQSTPDQVEEESQDQPPQAVGEAESDSDEDLDEQEESEEVETFTIDGEQYTAEEAKELLSKGKHYTYNMQQLRERERQLAQIAQQPNKQFKELSAEEQEIQEARKTLHKYGVVTEDQMEAKLRDFQLKQAKANQFNAFRASHPELTDTAARMIEGAAHAWGKTFEEVYQEGWKNIGSQKIVAKKTIGVSKKATTSISGKGGGGLTRADISKMSVEEYTKNADKIDEMIRKGELK